MMKYSTQEIKHIFATMDIINDSDLKTEIYKHLVKIKDNQKSDYIKAMYS